METARCKAFLASVEAGSFLKAAETLNYTASGVSQLVGALENDMGFPLLYRSKKGVSLNPNGERLLPAIRSFLKEEEKIYQLSAELKGLAVGSITIASYSSIAMHWLPAVIRSFQEDYPQIEIKLMEGIRQKVEGWLAERQADIAFMSYKEPMPYDWIPLAEDPMLAILPQEHPLASGKSYPIHNCRFEKFIMPALGRDADVVELLRKNDIEPNICFSTLENFSVMAMIEKGLGMSIMNGLITAGLQFKVKKLPLDPPQHITMGIALPSIEKAPPAVAKFVEYATEKITSAS